MIFDANLSLFCVHPISYHPHEEFEACTQCQQSDQLRNNFQRFLLIMSSDLTSCQEKSFYETQSFNWAETENIQNMCGDSLFYVEFYSQLQDSR